ncbi:MAG: carboxypeptidase-like regulatory domain-containing protein [Gammaproteobacteria bacterium]|nr:carboxypeptidase regulatory-like domain-containing protein [Pseudomonadales bacterium]
MYRRPISFTLILLWGLVAPAVVWPADPVNLLAQLEDFDLLQISQAQLRGFDSLPAGDVPTAATSEPTYTRQLIGLYVDGSEQPAITGLFDGEQYLLPLATIMDAASISISSDATATTGNGIRLNTPGGQATLDPTDLRIIDGQVMVQQSALTEQLLIAARFDQTSYAIFLELPWNRPEFRQAVQAQSPTPQFEPPSASLRNLRADLNYVSSSNFDGWMGDYFAAGNLAGGTWRFRVQQDEQGNARPFEYYWSRDYQNTQTLIGNTDFSLHPLLPTVEQTGVQMLYSTSPIPRSSYRAISGPNRNRGIANGIRNIEGVATPGSVAELRVDGGIVARTRVRLDGSYDFLNVELPTRGYSEVMVYILDRSSGTLLDSQNFSRRSGIELLAGGQHTLFATLGAQGNPLDDQYGSQGSAVAGQWRYGLTEDLTVELGSQRVGGLQGNEAALSMALFSNWFASLGYASSFDRDAVGLDLEGGSGPWSFDFRAREYEMTGLLDPDQQRRQWSRYLNYRYDINDQLTLGLVGRDVNASFASESFVLPSASWSNRRNFSLSAYPNIQGDYRLDSRYSLSRLATARYAYESNRHLVDYRQRDGRGQEYYANYRTGQSLSDRTELGVVHYSENELLGRVQLGLVANGSRFGYNVDWESRLLPGFNSRLRLAKGGYDVGIYEDEQEEELYLQWHMTLDFAVAQSRIVPADSSFGSLSSASLTGEVLLGGRRVASADNVDRIELVIDGDSYTALVEAGRYYLDGLEPGLHKISIDSRFLPIELMPGDNQDYWVRLEAGASTEVPLLLEARYAISGRVRNVDGENVTGLQLSILNAAGRQVGEVYTDRYGLYRADALAPGKYYVVAYENGERLSAIEVRITDAFLFEQDLLVP